MLESGRFCPGRRRHTGTAKFRQRRPERSDQFRSGNLGISFIVDPQVAGRVNIKMDKPIKKRDLFAVLKPFYG